MVYFFCTTHDEQRITHDEDAMEAHLIERGTWTTVIHHTYSLQHFKQIFLHVMAAEYSNFHYISALF